MRLRNRHLACLLLLLSSLSAAQGTASPAQTSMLSYGTPGTHVTVLENTLIRVMTDQPLSTKRSKNGMPVTFDVREDVIVNHVLVIPRGATIHGEVIRSKKAGLISGTPELSLRLDSLDLGGETYPLYTYQLKVRGASKTKPTASEVEGSAVIGAIAGSIVNGDSKGVVTPARAAENIAGGAAVGAGAVEAVAVITPRPVVKIPAESQMDFYLASPLSIQPVSEKEAERLAQRVKGSDPVLYVHGDAPDL